MLGLMMDKPLLISSLLEYAATYHGGTEIVSRTVEGPIHRYTYADAERRCRRSVSARATGSPRWPGTATATTSCITACRAWAPCAT